MILDGKVATPKEEWDYKMALNRARFEEQQYQNRATHYQGREVASPAPDGGPRRQSNKPKDDSSSKAKRVISQVFDLHGITETEINTDPNGIVTEVKKKIPSSVFDDEPFYSEARESARSSIATPPAVTYDFGGDGPPTRQSNRPITAEVPTSNDITIVSQVAWNDQFEDQTLGQSITGDAGNREPSLPGYPDYTTTYSHGLIIQDATTMVGSDDDLAYWNPETQTLNDEEGRVISRVENGDGTVTYRFNNSLGQNLQLPIDNSELEDEIVRSEASVEAIEAQLEAAKLPSVYVTVGEQAALQAKLAEEKAAVIAAHEALSDAEANLIEQEAKAQELKEKSILDEEAIKQTEEAKAKELAKLFADDDIDWTNPDLTYVIKTLQEEDPSGEAIETINNFAEWADEVSDEESQAAAEAYLEDLANQPTVNDRFKKAMAIAFAAMLFGDDFSTAMNTGFGVVADDYDEEKLEAQTIAEAEAALALKIAEEERAFIRGNLNSARDFQEAAALQLMKDKVAAEKAAKAANETRLNKNVELGDAILKDLFAQSSEHDNYRNLANKSVSSQMAGLLAKIEEFSPDGFQLDLRDNVQRQALGSVLKKFVSEQLHFQDGTAPDLATYAEEMFTKIELEQYTNINPDLIAPSRAYLQNERKVNMDELDKSQWHGLQQGTKETVRLGELIQQIAGISDGKTSIGEQTATHLLYKDYLMFKANRPKSFEEMAEIADNKGVGHFTQFVNVVLGDMLKDGHIDGYGMNFDPAYQAIKRSDYTSDEDFRKAQDNYIIKYIKDHPLDFQ